METTPPRDLTHNQQNPQLPPNNTNHTDEATNLVTKTPVFPPSCLYETQKDACSICRDSFTNPAQIIPCGHVFDLHCFQQWSPDGMEPCPMCRQYIKEIHHNFTESGSYSKIDTVALFIDSLCSLDENICKGAWEKVLFEFTSGEKTEVNEILRGGDKGCLLVYFETRIPNFNGGHYEFEYYDSVVLFERLSESRWRFTPVDEELQRAWPLLADERAFAQLQKMGYYAGDEYRYEIILTQEQALAVYKVCSWGRYHSIAMRVLLKAHDEILERFGAPSSDYVLNERDGEILRIFGFEVIYTFGAQRVVSRGWARDLRNRYNY